MSKIKISPGNHCMLENIRQVALLEFQPYLENV